MTPIGYTRDELFGLRHRDVTPARSLRKTIFRHRLWQTAYDRKQTWWKIQRQQHIKSKVCYVADRENAPPPEQKRQQRLLTPSAVKLGLLNAQSVGNSSAAIATIVNEGEYDVFMLTETGTRPMKMLLYAVVYHLASPILTFRVQLPELTERIMEVLQPLSPRRYIIRFCHLRSVLPLLSL